METKRKLPMELVRAGDVEMDRRSKRKRELPMELVSAGDAGVDRTWIRKRKLATRKWIGRGKGNASYRCGSGSEMEKERKLPMELISAGDETGKTAPVWWKGDGFGDGSGK